MSSEIKATNYKAKDGTAGISIADSTGNVSLSGTLSAGTLGSSVSIQTGSPIAVQLASSQSSSDTTQVDFNNTIVTSSYKTYRICINNVIPATDATEPLIYLSVNNGSSFIANIDSRRMFHKLTNTSSHGHEHNQAGYIQIGTDMGNDANEGFFGHVDLYGVSINTTNWAGGYANCMGRHGSDRYWWDNGIHIEKGVADAINFIRFKMSSGDMAEHDISLWGFK
jgi:hypothetical protein